VRALVDTFKSRAGSVGLGISAASSVEFKVVEFLKLCNLSSFG